MNRAELHRLVWSEPRTALAKKWGISDVAIGKLCVRSDIPAPPPGYWARKQAGLLTPAKPLPMRLPGQYDDFEVQKDANYHRWHAEIDVDHPPVPPTYSESVEELVEEALKRIGNLRGKRDLSQPHRGLAKVLKAETHRAEQSKTSYWRTDQTHFSGPKFQRQLRIFNSIFHCFEPIGAKCDVTEVDHWVQGRGHLYFLRSTVVIRDVGVALEILEPETPKGISGQKRADVTTLCVGSDSNSFTCIDTEESKIEKQLPEIIRAILTCAEINLRDHEQNRYEYLVERRNERIEKIAELKRKEEAARLAAIEARKVAIRKEIFEAAKAMQMAKDIRELVSAMREHPDCKDDGLENYRRWSQMALEEADSKDPMLHSFPSVFRAWAS